MPAKRKKIVDKIHVSSKWNLIVKQVEDVHRVESYKKAIW